MHRLAVTRDSHPPYASGLDGISNVNSALDLSYINRQCFSLCSGLETIVDKFGGDGAERAERLCSASSGIVLCILAGRCRGGHESKIPLGF